MSKSALMKTPTFDQDEKAKAIVDVMAEDGYPNMTEEMRARKAGLSLAEYRKYMKNPAFLDWLARRLPQLYKARLPELMNKMFEQAMDGAGRQQKMLLEVMGILDTKQESKNPNIIIINNIPNPDDLAKKADVIDAEVSDAE